MRKVRKPPETPGRVRFLSDDERTKLLAACQISRNRHLYGVVLAALSTGARKSEILQLRWRDIDLDRGFLRLSRTKNKERRAVPLVGQALELLRLQSRDQRPEAWAFPRADGLKPVLIEQAFKAACRRAKLSGFNFHDLRHTAASYLAMTGATLVEIAEVLGHKSINITKRYSHLTAAHTTAVVERMSQQFLAPQRGPKHI